ncbi:protein of unknown function [Streptomyces sp. KY75]|nr:protein of unknown function [Streptomyces sp. KY70]CAD5981834.1 protein of unknown function [Streptomyces sp. KY75]
MVALRRTRGGCLALPPSASRVIFAVRLSRGAQGPPEGFPGAVGASPWGPVRTGGP